MVGQSDGDARAGSDADDEAAGEVQAGAVACGKRGSVSARLPKRVKDRESTSVRLQGGREGAGPALRTERKREGGRGREREGEGERERGSRTCAAHSDRRLSASTSTCAPCGGGGAGAYRQGAIR